jgi:hypothetical protein
MEAKMKSRPLLMKGPLVRRTLSGEKTETRRLVKYSPTTGDPEDWCDRIHDSEFKRTIGDFRRFCPYGRVGDELWIRETWAPGDLLVQQHESDPPEYVAYRADDSLRRVQAGAPPSEDLRDNATPPVGVWRPAIFMPQVACRLRVRIVEVGIEPVQHITNAEARDEGVATLANADLLEMGVSRKRSPGDMYLSSASPRERFQLVWDLINGDKPGARWADDPYVWVVRYEVVR